MTTSGGIRIRQTHAMEPRNSVGGRLVGLLSDICALVLNSS